MEVDSELPADHPCTPPQGKNDSSVRLTEGYIAALVPRAQLAGASKSSPNAETIV